MFKLLSNLFETAPPSRHQINDLNIKLHSPGSIFYSDFTRITTKEIKKAFKLSDKPTYLSELITLSQKVMENKEDPRITIDREIHQTTILLNIISLAIKEHRTQLEASKAEIENNNNP